MDPWILLKTCIIVLSFVAFLRACKESGAGSNSLDPLKYLSMYDVSTIIKDGSMPARTYDAV